MARVLNPTCPPKRVDMDRLFIHEMYSQKPNSKPWNKTHSTKNRGNQQAYGLSSLFITWTLSYKQQKKSGILTELSAEASAAEAFALAAGEAFIPADQSTVVVSHACTLELMALWLTDSCLTWHHHLFCIQPNIISFFLFLDFRVLNIHDDMTQIFLNILLDFFSFLKFCSKNSIF